MSHKNAVSLSLFLCGLVNLSKFFIRYSSGVPRILEWEGSRCRRRRGVENGEGYPPPYWGKGLGRGLCPLPRKFFVFFVENAIFWRILTHLFLKSYANGRGSNPPNPLLGTPLRYSTTLKYLTCAEKTEWTQRIIGRLPAALQLRWICGTHEFWAGQYWRTMNLQQCQGFVAKCAPFHHYEHISDEW